jgi:hypothetical protein
MLAKVSEKSDSHLFAFDFFHNAYLPTPPASIRGGNAAERGRKRHVHSTKLEKARRLFQDDDAS